MRLIDSDGNRDMNRNFCSELNRALGICCLQQENKCFTFEISILCLCNMYTDQLKGLYALPTIVESLRNCTQADDEQQAGDGGNYKNVQSS